MEVVPFMIPSSTEPIRSGPPPTSRSLPNLALGAEPLSDLDDDLLELVSRPPEDPVPPPSPPARVSRSKYSPHATFRRNPSVSDPDDDEGQWGGRTGSAAAESSATPPPHSRPDEDLPRSASPTPSLGASIHSAPELELDALRPVPPLPHSTAPLRAAPAREDPIRGEEPDRRADSPAGLTDPEADAEEETDPHAPAPPPPARSPVPRDLAAGLPRRGRRRQRAGERLATLWDYLQEEIFTVEMEGEEGVKSERVTNFLSVPHQLEKIMVFGVFICLDSFLYTFTILPLRALAAAVQLLSNEIQNALDFCRAPRRRQGSSSSRSRHLRLSHKCDLTKAAILVGTLILLHRVTDASKMYHTVRGQETIKLYVLFNVLEIADRLCCSFGQDLQDSLFSRQTLGRRTDGSRPHLRPLALFCLTLAYVVAHSVVLFYQLITLNVAVNSFSNALLTLLLSNQFVEIKGSVFKKFEKENLFQLTCADIVERFQLGLMLLIISLRNLIARSSLPSLSLLSYLPSSPSSALSALAPPSLSLSAALALLHQSFTPAVVVLGSECAVDWLKHAFITKFNHLRPAVYGRFVDVLCKDLVTTAEEGAAAATAGGGSRPARSGQQPFVDQSPLVSRRLGFAALPLGCLVVRVIRQAFEMLADESGVDECALPGAGGRSGGFGGLGGGRGEEEDVWTRTGRWVVGGLVVGVGWICLVALKLLLGISLRAFASHRLLTASERLAEETLASRSRPKIGVSPAEEALDRGVTRLLDDEADGGGGAGQGVRKKGLEELGRYDMVKSRLW